MNQSSSYRKYLDLELDNDDNLDEDLIFKPMDDSVNIDNNSVSSLTEAIKDKL